MKPFKVSRLPRLIAAASAAVFASAILHSPGLLAQAPPAPPPAPAGVGDAKEYEAAEALFNNQKFQEAAEAFKAFLAKYKMFSPRSLDAKFRISIAYVQLAQYDEAIKELKELITNPKMDPAAKEMAQLLIAKSLTLKGLKMPSETAGQKEPQKKVFGEAIAEYDTFIKTYPKSRDMDSAQFLRATLLLQAEGYDDAITGFDYVRRIPGSPFAWEAMMSIGKTLFVQANTFLETKGGKEPKPEDIKKALELFDKSQPYLDQTYRTSGDVALQNDAVLFAGQMQLTRSQHMTAPDEEQQKKKQGEKLVEALEAFRAVRSVEEVVEAQNQKIKGLEQQIKLLKPGTLDYQLMKSRYENLIDHEEEKKEKLKSGQDQYLSARLSVTRIFLFLKKTDEARTLIRYLQGQKEILEKDKDAQATIAALLCLTYAEQRNTAKALETYEAFRAQYKGDANGDNLPLLVANLLVEEGDAKKAEEIVAQGQADYKDWRFTTESIQVLTAASLKRGDYKKTLTLSDQLLSGSVKPDVEMQALFIKASVQQAQALEASDAAMADQALATYKMLRGKFPNTAQSEDAWFNTSQILAGKDAAKALPEIEKYLAQFEGGGGKSPNTKKNIPTAQFLLGTCLDRTNQKEKAVEAWKKVLDKYPESEPAAGASFKIFDVYNEKKDFAAAIKLMEDFLQRYPKHENVYFAYSNIAEFLFSGTLDAKDGTKNQSAIANLEAGAKKLLDYVDYELSNNLEKKRGDGSLIKIADRWLKELAKLPSFVTQSPEQKAVWQKSVDGVASAIERLLKDYPSSERLSEGLERLVTTQNARRKAQQADAAQIETYFKDLAAKFGGTPVTKAKIDVAMASFLQDTDPKRAVTLMEDAFKALPEPIKAKDADGNGEHVVPSFTPSDFDRYMAGLFAEKRFDDITKTVARVRLEYPAAEKDDVGSGSAIIRDGQAVALFWEARLLQEQGKATEAGAKFATLKEKFPKSTKALEADYGVILGEFEQTGQVKDDYVPRLNKILGTQTGKSFELQAKSLFLIARIQEAKKDFDAAVETYAKIHKSFASVPKIAAEGLWKAAEIAEKQARGDAAYPVKTKAERRAAAEARAAEAKAAKDAAKAAAKPEETKPEVEKPAEPKPAPAKPADKTTVPAAAPQK